MKLRITALLTAHLQSLSLAADKYSTVLRIARCGGLALLLIIGGLGAAHGASGVGKYSSVGDFIKAKKTDSYYYDHRIRLNDPKEICIRLKDGKPLTEKCVRNRSQLWVMTLRGELMNASAPGKCLTSNGLNKNVTLRDCKILDGKRTARSRSQIWTISGSKKKRKIKNGDHCLHVKVRAKKKPLVLKSCSSGNKKQRQFVVGNKVEKPTPTTFTVFGFGDFRRCATLQIEGNKNCRIDYLSKTEVLHTSETGTMRVGFPYSAERLWGFHYGIGQNYDDSNRDDQALRLDLGERYSVDRCAAAHDNHWISEDDLADEVSTEMSDGKKSDFAKNVNVIHLVNCLHRVKPSNKEEDKVRKKGIHELRFVLPNRFHGCAKRSLTGGPIGTWGLLDEVGPDKLLLPFEGNYPEPDGTHC